MNDATPLAIFLRKIHTQIRHDNSGAIVADIPELSKANPDHFGFALVTMDGHIYARGDADLPFTMQSISKAFVFALTLEVLGEDVVNANIGVEPSGEAFNSVRLGPDGRPFNPMVNAGAIACAALLREQLHEVAWERITRIMGAFAGRELALDETVYQSELQIGDRNRAIAYLLRNAGRLRCSVDDALDLYCRQCALVVSARDLAIMGATLANAGLNPVTGVHVVSPAIVYRTLSVMASFGMDEYAGEWIHRVGLPAKSGVAGGVVAVMPSQFGYGAYSPLLDKYGNSVRGLRVCEELSRTYQLHLLNTPRTTRQNILADYGGEAADSGRSRRPDESACLADRRAGIRVLELYGTLTFADIDALARRIAQPPRALVALALDLHRAPGGTRAASRLFEDLLFRLNRDGILVALVGPPLGFAATKDVAVFDKLDSAIEWIEDALIRKHAPDIDQSTAVPLSEQPLLAGLSEPEIAIVAKASSLRSYEPGETIIAVDGDQSTVHFLLTGLVSVRLKGGRKLATLGAGTAIGEVALLDQPRMADVVAEMAVTSLEFPIAALDWPEMEKAGIRTKILCNVGLLLADRLRQLNRKLSLLRA